MKNNTLFFTPTLNEFGNASYLLLALTQMNVRVDFLVIDDGSTDGTIEELESLNLPNLKLVKRYSRFGLGSAHVEALKYGKCLGYEKLISFDSDGTHRPEDIIGVMNSLSKHDIVIGSRFELGGSMAELPLTRKLLSYSGHLVTKFGLGISLDCSSALRGYQLNNFDISFICSGLESSHYDFFQVSAYRISKLAVSTFSYPIILQKRISGESKLNFGLILNSLKELFSLIYKIKMRKLNY